MFEASAQDHAVAADRALRRLSIEEFFVDLLGGLVPGVLFFIAGGTVVLPVLHATLREQGKTNHPDIEGAVLSALEKTANTPSALWLAMFVLVVLVAYVVGHLFYRHDPNEPDRRSFRWLARHRVYGKTTDAVPWWKRPYLYLFRPWELRNREMLRAELACDNWDDCQFPYGHYDAYLRKRGLVHLVDWAQWTGSPAHRTKNYINRLKIQLRQHHPDRCASIVRNEAHVRLATSTWYVSGVLLALSTLALVWLVVLVASSRGVGLRGALAGAVGDFLPATVCCLAVVSFALYARVSIARFLHYQRMREVYYVLETALTALGTTALRAEARAENRTAVQS